MEEILNELREIKKLLRIIAQNTEPLADKSLLVDRERVMDALYESLAEARRDSSSAL